MERTVREEIQQARKRRGKRKKRNGEKGGARGEPPRQWERERESVFVLLQTYVLLQT